VLYKWNVFIILYQTILMQHTYYFLKNTNIFFFVMLVWCVLYVGGNLTFRYCRE